MTTTQMLEAIVTDVTIIHPEQRHELVDVLGDGAAIADDYLRAVYGALVATDPAGPVEPHDWYGAAHAVLVAAEVHDCPDDLRHLVGAMHGTAGRTHRGLHAAFVLKRRHDTDRLRELLAGAAQQLDLGADPAVVAARLARTAA